ncbi:hypothetical protein LCGC14_0801820 [marine sediment metagenome]|uniref:Uncharacterized protein n=1 Tax=marine sediment metagenome TaxID=412755 RepID=A0A0F9SWJ4_9ZZZZ
MLRGQNKKDYQRKYMERKRSNKGLTNGGSTTEGLTKYHPIMYAIVDLVKRKKLEAICMSLKNHNVLEKVYYGVGVHSLSMDVVGDLLEATSP